MSRRNRREFLEESMFAAAAAVAAGSAGPLLAADEVQSKSPNEKLGVAVVGVKGRGGTHIGAFAGRKDTEILYVCDADSDIGNSRADEIAKRQGKRPTFQEDIRKVLEDKRVDIVSIATPNHWHALGAIWSIQAGKDVYVEKPVSHNVSEGRRIVDAARKYDKICQTGTQCRSNPGLIEAVDFVKAGGIGSLKVARGLCYKRRGSIGERGTYDPPASVNYDLWSGPAQLAPVTRPQFHYDWHWQWAYGNGDLGNQGIHQMDIARWGMGVNQLSNSVISYGGRFGYVDAGDSANTQVVIHDYDDQALVFEVRGLKTDNYKGAGVGVIFEGTDGYVVVSSYDTAVAFDKSGAMTKTFKGSADHFGNFLTAVRSRQHTDLNADIEEGHYSSALCHLGNISYRLGESVPAGEVLAKLGDLKTTENAKETFERTLGHLRSNELNTDKLDIVVGQHLAFDPKTETFQDNSTADQLLTRDYRKPFEVPSAANV